RQAAGVDVEPFRRLGRTAVPRTVESREGARGSQERASQKAGQEIMMRRSLRLAGVTFAVCLAVTSGSPRAQQVASASKTRAHVETLASRAFEGRLTGSAGERLAGDYFVSELQKIGAKPLPGQADFRLSFEFTAGTRDGGSSVSVTSGGANSSTFSM